VIFAERKQLPHSFEHKQVFALSDEEL